MNRFQLLSLVLLVLFAAACGKEPKPSPTPSPNPNPTAGYIELVPSRLNLASGQQQRVTATVYVDGEVVPNAAVKWESSNPALVTVDQTGLVSASSDYNLEGTADITASYEDLFAVLSVKVSAPVLVSSLSFKPDAAEVLLGATMQLHPVVLPDDANLFNYQWTSSNPAVATVDQDGLVTAVGLGSCQVTVAAEGGAEASMKIAVVTPYQIRRVYNDAYVLPPTTFTVDAYGPDSVLTFCVFDQVKSQPVYDIDDGNFRGGSTNPRVASVKISGSRYLVRSSVTGKTDVQLLYTDAAGVGCEAKISLSVSGINAFESGSYIGVFWRTSGGKETCYRLPQTLYIDYTEHMSHAFEVCDKDGNHVQNNKIRWTVSGNHLTVSSDPYSGGGVATFKSLTGQSEYMTFTTPVGRYLPSSIPASGSTLSVTATDELGNTLKNTITICPPATN